MLNFLREHQHFKDFISVVWATCITETIIYPITTARIRMQMRRVSNQANSLTAGKTMRKIAKNEGFMNLFSGLLVNYLRQVVFHSFQISMETPINMRLDGEEYSIHRSAARVAVGLVGLVLIQPFVVVKVRYQAGIYPRKLSMITLFRTIYEKEGPRGLYRGLTLNGFRSAIAFTSDKFSRDPLDEFIKDRKTGEREKYMIITGATTFITVLLTNPIDVVRNRYINAKCGEFKSVLLCVARILSEEGPHALYKGFTAYYYSTFLSSLLIWYIYDLTRNFIQPKDDID